MTDQLELGFENKTYQPLATRMRPKTLEEIAGQPHLLQQGKPLQQTIKTGKLHSMILWGPPGTGKTTIAKLIAQTTNAHIETLSAVLSGVKEIRTAIQNAKTTQTTGKQTILFIDEIHRFNKGQQDALLPHIEDGTIIFIGATTENPSFELNNALLSRARVHVLKPLTNQDIKAIIDRTLKDKENGLGNLNIKLTDQQKTKLIKAADGDARRALNILEILTDHAEKDQNGQHHINDQNVQDVLTLGWRRFDKGGDQYHDQISAMHKSIRGSNPDAALYWCCRMLDGGCDPKYIARRLVRTATEDIGNADPRALQITLNAWDTYDRLGTPEGELAIAQAVIYLAIAAKSNAVYKAYNEVMADIKQQGTLEVPKHIRNAPTKLQKQLEHGKDYRYAHNEPDAYAAGETYMPKEIQNKKYYHPVNRGLETKIAEKLAHLAKLDKLSLEQSENKEKKNQNLSNRPIFKEKENEESNQ